MKKVTFSRIVIVMILAMALGYGYLQASRQIQPLVDRLAPPPKNRLIILTPLPTKTLSVSPNDQQEPDIFNQHIVWSENIDGYWQIILFDLSNSSRAQLTSGLLDHVSPDISNDIVIWLQGEPGDPDQLAGVNLLTGQSLKLPDGQVAQPRLDDLKMVWLGEITDTTTFVWPLHMFEIGSQTNTILTQGRGLNSPAISGNIVVWEDYRNQRDTDIYGYDLSKQQEFPIVTVRGNQETPSISDNIVVWRDNRNTNRFDDCDIYGYDLTTQSEFYIARAGRALNLNIIDNYVIWDSIAGLYAYDLKSQKVFTIADETSGRGNRDPSLFGEVIVWTQFDGLDRNAHSQIVMGQIPTQP